MKFAVAVAVVIGSAIGFVLTAYISQKYSLKLDLLVATVGTMVGGVGLAFGAFFALLAVDAYGHIKSIQRVSASAEAVLGKIHQKHASFEQIQRDSEQLQREITDVYKSAYEIGDRVFTACYQLVTSLPKQHSENSHGVRRQKLADDMILARARYALHNRFLTDEEIFTHMLTLAEKGDGSDVKLLDIVASDEKRTIETRQAATRFVSSVRKRLADAD